MIRNIFIAQQLTELSQAYREQHLHSLALSTPYTRLILPDEETLIGITPEKLKSSQFSPESPVAPQKAQCF